MDQTEQQLSGDLKKSRDLSLDSVQPPAAVAGYRIQKLLGQGAYGEVWSAISQKTGRKVAIKFYTRRSSSDVRMLAREVEKLAVIGSDRYVVGVLDVGWDAEPPYYVMDYIEHGSLEDRLKENRTIPVSEAIELFQEIATGMMHLHGKQILHCDLKPGNVLLDQDGKPHVADFGQARLSTDETPALGTLFYMAPEQAHTDAMPEARWDVYGLGALLYSMLTGKPPYYNEQLAAEIEATGDLQGRLDRYRESLYGQPVPTDHRRVPGVDRGLAEIIDRCICVDKRRRYASIQSVLLALRQREETRARRPVMLLGLLGPLLLTAVITLFGWWAINRAVSVATTGISEKAVAGNRFVAALGARSAAARIDEYFRVIDRLARNDEFVDAFEEMVLDQPLAELRQKVADPRNNESTADAMTDARDRLINHPVRYQKLQEYMNERLGNQEDFPRTDSWFVCDRYGNQIVSAFPGEDGCIDATSVKTLGRNYSYRTYFTGLADDIEFRKDGNQSADPANRKIIDRPHMSAPFESKSSGTFKVAFAQPVIINGKPEGVLACTVELGNLIEFEGTSVQYAMLVDGRSGSKRGMVLEHPWFRGIIERNRLGTGETELTPQKFLGETMPDLRWETLAGSEPGELEDFSDPVGTSEGASQYSRRHFASIAPVNIRKRADLFSQTGSADTAEIQIRQIESEPSGLFVVAVEDYDAVVQPSTNLARTLGWIALGALALLTAVAVTMWILVDRMMQESRERLARAFAPSAESASLENMETVAAPEL